MYGSVEGRLGCAATYRGRRHRRHHDTHPPAEKQEKAGPRRRCLSATCWKSTSRHGGSRRCWRKLGNSTPRERIAARPDENVRLACQQEDFWSRGPPSSEYSISLRNLLIQRPGTRAIPAMRCHDRDPDAALRLQRRRPWACRVHRTPIVYE